MQITQTVKQIINNYEGEAPGVKAQLARLLMHGRLAGTGKLLILAVDQGFEHGPWRSFAMNPDSYDPHYHYNLAIAGELSAYAAPLGWLEAGADTFAGAVPLILKMNSNNALISEEAIPDQAITASIRDALRLGCSAIGFTIYPGSEASLDMFEEVSKLAAEARACGLAVVIWSYPRGDVSKAGETSIDVITYGAHIAALLGAHIIKVKPPTAHLETHQAKEHYLRCGIKIGTLRERVHHVVQSCFNGRRLVIFSGMEIAGSEQVLSDVEQIVLGGGSGSIIGRNAFKRPYDEALELLRDIQEIYLKPRKPVVSGH